MCLAVPKDVVRVGSVRLRRAAAAGVDVLPVRHDHQYAAGQGQSAADEAQVVQAADHAEQQGSQAGSGQKCGRDALVSSPAQCEGSQASNTASIARAISSQNSQRSVSPCRASLNHRVG